MSKDPHNPGVLQNQHHLPLTPREHAARLPSGKLTSSCGLWQGKEGRNYKEGEEILGAQGETGEAGDSRVWGEALGKEGE